jgi:hypothetical protein
VRKLAEQISVPDVVLRISRGPAAQGISVQNGLLRTSGGPVRNGFRCVTPVAQFLSKIAQRLAARTAVFAGQVASLVSKPGRFCADFYRFRNEEE